MQSGLSQSQTRAAALFIALAIGGCSSSGGGPGGPDLVDNAHGADNATLNGFVTLPGTVPAGAGLQVGIASPGIGSAWTGSELFGGTMKSKSNVASFSIGRLDAADFLVFIRVDANGSGDFGSGDYGGYFGPGGAPTLDPTNATVVAMEAGATKRIDFTAGTIP